MECIILGMTSLGLTVLDCLTLLLSPSCFKNSLLLFFLLEYCYFLGVPEYFQYYHCSVVAHKASMRELYKILSKHKKKQPLPKKSQRLA